GVGARQLLQASSDDFQAGVFETRDDLADDVLGHGVGLDDRESTLDGHGDSKFLMKTGTSVRFTVTRHSNTPSSPQYILKYMVCLAVTRPGPRLLPEPRNDRSRCPDPA